jgi:diadenylate cyclase
LRLNDLLDIAIVAVLVYQVYWLLVGTRALNLARGVAVFVLIWAASSVLELRTMTWLIQNAATVGLVALIVVFQPELRAALERLGRGRLWGGGLGVAASTINEICEAVGRLQERRTGALMVIARRTPLGEYIRTGTTLNAKVTADLLASIFYPNSPLHDGAVIVAGDRVEAASCLLPLTDGRRSIVGREYGTRHRAALGISEVTDAVAIVVSEETGRIAMAIEGSLLSDLDIVALRLKLTDLYQRRSPTHG